MLLEDDTYAIGKKNPPQCSAFSGMPDANQRLTFRAAVTQVVLVKGQKEAQLPFKSLSASTCRLAAESESTSNHVFHERTCCFTSKKKKQRRGLQNKTGALPSHPPPPPLATLIHKGFKWQLKNKTPLLSRWTYVLCRLPVWPVSCVCVHSLPHRPPSGSRCSLRGG